MKFYLVLKNEFFPSQTAFDNVIELRGKWFKKQMFPRM